MYHIKVPATTANMGAGFDSIGMALKLYNNLWVCERESGIVIEIEPTGDYRPETDENNLIYRSFCRFYDETGKKPPQGIKMVQRDFIPQTRGLGSSAACVVSGLLAGNALSGANLSKDDICRIAAKIEGHPDNSTPAIVGGITVGAIRGEKLEYIKLNAPRLSELEFAVIVPNFTLPTEKSRGVLPDSYSRADAVFNISRAALMVAAFESGDFTKLNTAMDDRVHQPYRLPLVPGMETLLSESKKAGAFAAFLSGAGPAIIAVVPKQASASFLLELNLKSIGGDWSVMFLEPDVEGAVVEEC